MENLILLPKLTMGRVGGTAQESSAGNSLCMPISKPRNKHLQTVLIAMIRLPEVSN